MGSSLCDKQKRAMHCCIRYFKNTEGSFVDINYERNIDINYQLFYSLCRPILRRTIVIAVQYTCSFD